MARHRRSASLPSPHRVNCLDRCATSHTAGSGSARCVGRARGAWFARKGTAATTERSHAAAHRQSKRPFSPRRRAPHHDRAMACGDGRAATTGSRCSKEFPQECIHEGFPRRDDADLVAPWSLFGYRNQCSDSRLRGSAQERVVRGRMDCAHVGDSAVRYSILQERFSFIARAPRAQPLVSAR